MKNLSVLLLIGAVSALLYFWSRTQPTGMSEESCQFLLPAMNALWEGLHNGPQPKSDDDLRHMALSTLMIQTGGQLPGSSSAQDALGKLTDDLVRFARAQQNESSEQVQRSFLDACEHDKL